MFKIIKQKYIACNQSLVNYLTTKNKQTNNHGTEKVYV